MYNIVSDRRFRQLRVSDSYTLMTKMYTGIAPNSRDKKGDKRRIKNDIDKKGPLQENKIISHVLVLNANVSQSQRTPP
jgi:hypothetical protein